MVQEDPLGACAVEYIKYNVAPIVGSYEGGHLDHPTAAAGNRWPPSQNATGASAIRSELSEALAAFSPGGGTAHQLF